MDKRNGEHRLSGDSEGEQVDQALLRSYRDLTPTRRWAKKIISARGDRVLAVTFGALFLIILTLWVHKLQRFHDDQLAVTRAIEELRESSIQGTDILVKSSSQLHSLLSAPEPWTSRRWVKPSGFKIIAIIFYGRPHTVNVLDCYLQKNMATNGNGGYIDEVHFLQRTDNGEDIAWLRELVVTRPGYRIIDEEGVTKDCEETDGERHCHPSGFSSMWKHVTDKETMYLKIDDDIIYMHDDTIPSMVHTLLAHSSAHLVLSNTVNNPMTNWLHYQLGAIYPYLPEPTDPDHRNPDSNANNHPTWRASDLPSYPTHDLPDEFDMATPPPFEGHRWLALPDTPANMARTPLKNAFYDPDSYGWKSWAFAAQQHYSLLQHLEANTTQVYNFGNRIDNTWDMKNVRYSINAMAIWGRDIIEHPPEGDDEQDLTVEIPKRLGRKTLVQGRALVAHFHYSGQQGDVMKTDLLGRFMAYANERVCTSDNQKSQLREGLS